MTLFFSLWIAALASAVFGDPVYDNVFYVQQDESCPEDLSFTQYVFQSGMLPQYTASDLSEALKLATVAVRKQRCDDTDPLNWFVSLKGQSRSFRRDAAIGALNLVYYNVMHEATDGGIPGNTPHVNLSIAYQEEAFTDVIDNSLLPKNALLKAAKKLPCARIDTNDFAHLFKTKYILPNDPYILPSEKTSVGQWYLGGPGVDSLQSDYGANVLAAWTLYRGEDENDAPRIAIIDSGCSAHPDLYTNYWSQTAGERGKDMTNERQHPLHEPLNAIHGTPVAGMIAATPNNAYGGAGICWGCKVACLKVYDDAGNFSQKAFLEALEVVATSKIRILYLEHTTFEFSVPEAVAFEQLQKSDVLVVAPAGDHRCNLHGVYPQDANGCRDSKGNSRAGIYPASYNLSNVLIVGSSEEDGSRSKFSNWGKALVHVMAPGSELLLPYNTVVCTCDTLKVCGCDVVALGPDIMAPVYGTSYSAALVTGVAGLIRGSASHLNATEVKNLIIQTARKSERLAEACVAGGVIDAHAALTAAKGKRDLGEPKKHAYPGPDVTATYYNSGAITVAPVLSSSLMVLVLSVVFGLS